MSATNFIFLLIVALCFSLGQSDNTKVFNVKHYGAVEGGKNDISQSLLKAWNDACKRKGESIVEISQGTYLVNPTILRGPCSGPILFKNLGTLKAPLGLRGNYWIEFRNLESLTLDGGGTFDGQGPPKRGEPNLPTLLRYTFVKNSVAQNIKLLNSQNTHFHLFGCNQTVIRQIQISSPGDSPNTDGIKISRSTGITIDRATIASGDDCVAIIRGSKDIKVTRVVCGPGHGFSIGSMGKSPNERVEQVVMQDCKIFGATNGLRIKTWATDMPGLVRNVLYENIELVNVDNPIIIEQNYCPSKTCPKGNSRVQISDVKFRNIQGTSKTNNAVNLQCSGSNPCEKIELKDIDIKFMKDEKRTISTCSHVNVQAIGVQIPKVCSIRI